MSDSKCTNCLTRHKVTPDVCIPAALLGVAVHERQTVSDFEAESLLANLNADRLWDDIAPIIDRLEKGEYVDYCPTCKHYSHEAAACKSCNCGESDIVHGKGSGFLVPRNDGSGQMKGSGGRRAYKGPSSE